MCSRDVYASSEPPSASSSSAICFAERLAAVVSGEPCDLIETLADRLATVCLSHPLVFEVEITVHKPSAPIALTFDDVSVTVVRP